MSPVTSWTCIHITQRQAFSAQGAKDVSERPPTQRSALSTQRLPPVLPASPFCMRHHAPRGLAAGSLGLGSFSVSRNLQQERSPARYRMSISESARLFDMISTSNFGHFPRVCRPTRCTLHPPVPICRFLRVHGDILDDTTIGAKVFAPSPSRIFLYIVVAANHRGRRGPQCTVSRCTSYLPSFSQAA